MNLHEMLGKIRPEVSKEGIDPLDPTLSLNEVAKLTPWQQIVNGVAFDMQEKEKKDPHKYKGEITRRAEEAFRQDR